MSEELIKLLFEGGDYSEALNYSENLLRYDKLNLISYEYTIKSYENINKHRLAREKYSQLLKIYNSEYGENPPIKFTESLKTVLN
jgi:DNA-binding SARP family transcriptional activator